jgi:glutamine amidotransferase
VPGLGLLEGRATRLQEGRVPRMGWATVDPWGEAFYFAHSYAADTPAATARSEGVVAAAESGGFLGVQFHPEKSGPAGARFLERCLSRA